ncbi:MAG TPA: glycoside hydrolase family 28 protein [Duganella sp.]|jgi:polygalacturonase
MTARRDFMHKLAGGAVVLAGGLPARLLAAQSGAGDAAATAATAPAVNAVNAAAARGAAAAAADPWRQAQAIIDRFATPLAFRKEDFVITAFGGKACDVVPIKAWVSSSDQAEIRTPAPNATDCYPAISAAIAACNKAGGGRVLIPSGNWLCAGPIVLLSNVHVHLAKGAHVYFSANPADYARHGEFDCGANGKLSLTRWEGNDCLNFSSLVYAHGQRNIALTGEDWTSILDGQAGVPFPGDHDCWWSWKGRVRKGEVHVPHTVGKVQERPNPRNRPLGEIAPHLSAAEAKKIQGDDPWFLSDSHYLRALSEARVPAKQRIFGIGHFLRPHMVQFISCTDVLLSNYQTTNTPFWQHNPVDCDNVHVKGVYANSMGANNDGFDPESCRNVLIDGCQFNTGDDCIAIDSGKGTDTQFGPCENVVVQYCRMHSGHGALTLGSIMSGGIQNVFAQNLVFENANWKTDPLNIAIRLKTNMARGGFLRNFYVRNVQIPNGIRTTPSFYKPTPGSGIPAQTVAAGAGGVITFDCDYSPLDDTIRTRPPLVTNVHISGIKVGNVQTKEGKFSCYQPIVVLGPVAVNYNGAGKPQILPVSNVTISDSDFGTPVAKQPAYLYNVKDLVLKNVTIGGKVFNQTLSG